MLTAKRREYTFVVPPRKRWWHLRPRLSELKTQASYTVYSNGEMIHSIGYSRDPGPQAVCAYLCMYYGEAVAMDCAPDDDLTPTR